MAKELPYFKFFPAEWFIGYITNCSMSAQGLFINICNYYWMRSGDLTLTYVEHKFNTCSTELEELLNRNIIRVEQDVISINFLDEQFSEFEILRSKKINAGKASAKIRKGNTCSTPVQHVFNKEREDKEKIKIREDKSKKFIHPSLEEVKKYFIENGYSQSAATKAFNYYNTAQWVDSKGNKVRNWKQKMISVWFKDENKIQTKQARTNHSADPVPKDYGIPSEKAVPMPESLKHKITQIGKV